METELKIQNLVYIFQNILKIIILRWINLNEMISYLIHDIIFFCRLTQTKQIRKNVVTEDINKVQIILNDATHSMS